MLYKVVKGAVMYDGKLHRKDVTLEADPLHMKKLVAEGFVVPVEADELPGSAVPIESDPIESDDQETVELPTPEEFAAMKADQQKKLLAEAGIEPASNAEGRMAQFMQLYESADEE